ncbi:MAG: M56 family metallopeptidase [Nesterenkonia sp.]|nr:M56 family metallopeptidase [Nesterenkonia sp.]
MIWLAAFLALLAVLMAAPAPRLLSGATFRLSSPWTAMLLWQAMALAGGLSLIGAPLVFGLIPFGDSVPSAVAEVLRLVRAVDYGALEDRHVSPVHLFSLCLAVLLAGHLLLTLLRTSTRTLAARRRHRDLVRLLSSPAHGGSTERGTPVEGSGTGRRAALIIDHETPLAYCLPGVTAARSMTVLSQGMLDALGAEDLDAVVAHEHTHLQQRHHLLTMAFEAWYRALPWLPTTRYGREAVLELTEMLADDGALRDHPREALVRSLALGAPASEATTDETSSDGPLAAAHHDDLQVTAARLRRLLSPPPQMGRTARGAVVVLAASLMVVPTAMLLIV